jgi:hypothetical protein
MKQAGNMALVFGTRNADLIDTGRLDYKPLIGHDHQSASCTPALLVAAYRPTCSAQSRSHHIIAYASPLAISQQLISEKNPVPILGSAAARKLRYPSPAFTFDCPKNPASQ